MNDELIPFFSEHYKGPTRTSIADLKGQALLKGTRGPGQYLWVTIWDGGPESIRADSFEGTRMTKIEGTDAMLAKLATFGNRSTASVFHDLLKIDVPTNV